MSARRYVLVVVAGGLALGQVLVSRAERRAAELGTRLGEYFGQRHRDSTRTEAAMLDLTKSLRRLTWALLVVGIVTLAIPVFDWP